MYSDIYNPFTGGDDSDEESRDITYKPTQSELRATDREENKDSRDNKERKPNIANALLKRVIAVFQFNSAFFAFSVVRISLLALLLAQIL